MTHGIENRHKQQIYNAVSDIFGHTNIESAFITGSIPAGKSRPDSDIDIFVSLSDHIDSPDERKKEFTDFYFAIHEQLGREPDYISPGEVLSLSGLYTATRRIQKVAPAAVLHDRDEFDAICWAGMLVSKRDVLIPSSERMESIRKISQSIVHRWARELAPNTTLTEETGECTDADKVLRRTISSPGYYDAH
jgi:predicted nucleotidyltransferase